MARIVLTESVFRTADLPTAERLTALHETMTKVAFPMDVHSEHSDTCTADVRLLQTGGVTVGPAALSALRFRRTPRLIRQADPECYHLTLPLHGTIDISQHGRAARHGAHQMHIIDSSHPFDCRTTTVTGVSLAVRRTLVPLPHGKVERLLTRPLCARRGVGALLAGVITQIGSGGPYLPSDGPRLERVVSDLFSALLAHHLDAEDSLAPEARSRALTLRIRTFVERRLHDPDLTPPAIAAAHHISLSYLHRLFRAEGTTVAGMIRRGRLEGARRDLSDPALAATPIHTIATRWGFKSHADFTRSYRTAYGISPREQRRQSHPAVSALVTVRQPAASPTCPNNTPRAAPVAPLRSCA